MFSGNLEELTELTMFRMNHDSPLADRLSTYKQHTIFSAYINLSWCYENTFEKCIYREMPDYSGELLNMQEAIRETPRKVKYLLALEPRILAAPIRKRIGTFVWSCHVGMFQFLA